MAFRMYGEKYPERIFFLAKGVACVVSFDPNFIQFPIILIYPEEFCVAALSQAGPDFVWRAYWGSIGVARTVIRGRLVA